MFEKLLSLAPYNPGMIHHLAFYGRRMREEASIRRVGVIFLALAFVVQSIAVINPPVSASPGGDNDLWSGGFSTIPQAEAACKNKNSDYGTILDYYDITCEQVGKAKSTYIHTNGPAGSPNRYSSGRNLSPTRDHPVQINDNTKIYWRDLSIWGGEVTCPDDRTRSDCWHVMSLTNSSDKTYYIIFDCGNLVSDGLPEVINTATITIGTGHTSAPNPVATTTAPPVLGNPGVQNPSPDRSPYIPEGTTTVPVPITSQQVNPCIFNPVLDAGSPDCPDECQTNPAIPATSEQCFYPCPYNGTIPDSDSACKPCDKSVSIDDAEACIMVHKTAANITQNISDASNTTAKAGDVITYTLYAQNNGKATIYDFTFQENLSDVLDYADLADPHGGTLVSSDNVIAWPKRDLEPGQSASVQVSVKVKDPIPQTPVATNKPGGFDMIMTNVYGNSININLPAAPAKSIETAAAKLPNTGPGTTLFIASMVVMLAGYFYSRASLLARESDIAVKESV